MTKKEANILKFFAILLMYIHHLFYNVADINSLPIVYGPLIPNAETWSAVGFTAKICVSIFVFISGYGTTRANMIRANSGGGSCLMRLTDISNC